MHNSLTCFLLATSLITCISMRIQQHLYHVIVILNLDIFINKTPTCIYIEHLRHVVTVRFHHSSSIQLRWEL